MGMAAFWFWSQHGWVMNDNWLWHFIKNECPLSFSLGYGYREGEKY